ncbi:MAG: mechanosensitive ion channel family protein [Acidobacteria bacterium]|nr:MAG: mechanosensitive ion channel family protein [Acidobacteriota bacterium]
MQAPDPSAADTPARLPTLGDRFADWGAPEALVDAWRTVEAYPIVAAAIIVLLAFVAGKAVQAVVARGVSRLTEKTRTSFDDKVVELLHRPLFLTVFFLGLTLALGVLELPPGLRRRLVQVLMTLLLIVWLTAVWPILRMVLDALGRHHERFPLVEERTIPLFDITGKIVLLGTAGYVLLAIWGVDPTPWLAAGGVAGLAVGFAAKDTLANLFGGIFIVADAPYKVGDFIILDSGERGVVTKVGMRSTRLLTRDDIEITLPNAQIANAKIINESGGPWEKERIRIKVGVAYGSDVDRVCEVLKRIAAEHEHIVRQPEPRVRLRAFGASSLDFELLCWIDEPVLRGRLSHELNMAVYKAFAREGIEIPYAKHDVYVKEMPAG